MPLPNHLQQQQFNKTDSNLLREEEDTAELQQQVLRRANPLVRRSSLMNDELMKRQDSTKRLPREDSMKRLPGDEENHSFKKLPFGDETSGIHERQMSTKRLPRRNSILDESGTIVDTSFKRLPSVANGRTSGLFDEPGSIQRQSSVNNRSDDAPLLHRRMSIKEMANMSGGDLLNRQSTMTRRNSIASEDSRPSLARRGSIVGGLMKALRLDETDEEKRRRIVKSWDDFKELYRMGAPIGKGTQGQVIKGVRIQDDLPVVIKIMEDHFIKPWNMVAKMPVSAYLLRALNYPEQGRQDPLFLEYVDHFHVEKNWILVTEYEEHEWIDLYDYVRQRKERLTEFECLSIFGGIAQALMRLHSDGFTHNDIKENNVLIHADTLAIKLIDLCSCREITPSEVSPSEFAGTLVYASPEIRNRNFFNPESQDVYALGVLLLFLLFQGRFPLSVNLDKEFLESSTLPKIIKESKLEVSSATVKMLQGILSKRVEKRPGIAELVDTVQSRLDAMAGDS